MREARNNRGFDSLDFFFEVLAKQSLRLCYVPPNKRPLQFPETFHRHVEIDVPTVGTKSEERPLGERREFTGHSLQFLERRSKCTLYSLLNILR